MSHATAGAVVWRREMCQQCVHSAGTTDMGWEGCTASTQAVNEVFRIVLVVVAIHALPAP
eukprot:scaffold27044_cov37-Attheya_sp.AAC.1